MSKAATARRWVLPAVAAVLLAAHVLAFYRIFSLARLGLAAVVGVIVMVMINHLGLFGVSLSMLRRRLRRRHAVPKIKPETRNPANEQ